MSKATPGPWRVVIDDDGNPLSGRPSVQAADEYDCAIVHGDGFVQEYWRSARGDKEIHANARLIAAAPDMLDALILAEQAMNYLGDILNNMDAVLPEDEAATGGAFEAVRAAIAKATAQVQP